MPTALVTRPREDAEGTAALLRARGFEVLIEPLLDVADVADARVELAGAQGFLVTSANGARALARACPERGLPVWAVGDSSAGAARALGFAQVESAKGDVEALAALVRERVNPANGALVHAAGSVVAGDLAGLLDGFEVRRAVLYQTRAAQALSGPLVEALDRGGIDVALFFSPRTARTFATLARAAGLAPRLAAVSAYCLSPAVARAFEPPPWRLVRTAAEPTQAALLAALDQDLGR